MRSFAALGSLVYAAREAAREEVAAPLGDGGPARSIRSEGAPGCPWPQQTVVPVIADCCVLQQICSQTAPIGWNAGPVRWRREWMAGPSRAAAPHARPRKADQPSVPPASRRGPFLQDAEAGQSSERKRVPLWAHLGAVHFNSNICLTPHGVLVSFAANTSGLVWTGADDRFTRAAVAVLRARSDIAAPDARGVALWCYRRRAATPSGRRCGWVPRPSGLAPRVRRWARWQASLGSGILGASWRGCRNGPLRSSLPGPLHL